MDLARGHRLPPAVPPHQTIRIWFSGGSKFLVLQQVKETVGRIGRTNPLPQVTNFEYGGALGPVTNFHCDIRASFAVAFRNWRRKNDIPLKKIAVELGVSIAAVNSWESGQRFPSARHFEMIADYTGVPPCRLFCIMADSCIPAECLLALPHKRPVP